MSARPRPGPHHDPAADNRNIQLRRGRHLPPKGLDAEPRNGDDLDAQMLTWQASQLPGDLDPDTIDDPQLRAAYIDRLTAEFARDLDNQPTAPEPGSPPAPAGAAPARPASLRLPGRATRGRQGAELFLGLIVYANAAAYMRGGSAGVKGWWSAKLFNRVTAGAAPTPKATVL